MNPRHPPRDDTYATSVMMGDAFESSRAVAGLHLQGLECSSADSRRRDFISWLFVVTRESGTSSIARATSGGLWVCDIRSVQIGASRVRERASSRADDAHSSHRCRNRASRARRKFHPSSVPDLGETARRREIITRLSNLLATRDATRKRAEPTIYTTLCLSFARAIIVDCRRDDRPDATSADAKPSRASRFVPAASERRNQGARDAVSVARETQSCVREPEKRQPCTPSVTRDLAPSLCVAKGRAVVGADGRGALNSTRRRAHFRNE